MIRHVKTEASGFTLLEMVISLFILMLLLGMAVNLTRNALANEDMREASRKIQIFAKTARKQALRENRPWEIVLYSDSLVLRPSGNEESKANEASAGAKIQPVQYSLPEGILLGVKLWGSKEWAPPRNLAWTFSPNGLCAPHRFHFARGESWIEMSFSPLTANPQNEEFYLP